MQSGERLLRSNQQVNTMSTSASRSSQRPLSSSVIAPMPTPTRTMHDVAEGSGESHDVHTPELHRRHPEGSISPRYVLQDSERGGALRSFAAVSVSPATHQPTSHQHHSVRRTLAGGGNTWAEGSVSPPSSQEDHSPASMKRTTTTNRHDILEATQRYHSATSSNITDVPQQRQQQQQSIVANTLFDIASPPHRHHHQAIGSPQDNTAKTLLLQTSPRAGSPAFEGWLNPQQQQQRDEVVDTNVDVNRSSSRSPSKTSLHLRPSSRFEIK